MTAERSDYAGRAVARLRRAYELGREDALAEALGAAPADAARARVEELEQALRTVAQIHHSHGGRGLRAARRLACKALGLPEPEEEK